MMKKMVKASFVLASLLFIGQIIPAIAEDNHAAPFATFNVRVGNNGAFVDNTDDGLAPTAISKDNIAFRIENNTGQALYFDSPDHEYIPVVSNNTVTTPYVPGQEYKVLDAGGKTVASWSVGTKAIASAGAASASAEKFAAWDKTLQDVIANQKVNYQEPPPKPEPVYASAQPEAPKTTSGDTVRGFW